MQSMHSSRKEGMYMYRLIHVYTPEMLERGVEKG